MAGHGTYSRQIKMHTNQVHDRLVCIVVLGKIHDTEDREMYDIPNDVSERMSYS